MGEAHPDAAVRVAAKVCEPKSEKFTTKLYLDADAGAVLKAYAAKNEKLEGERARLLSDTLRDFHRNGLDLPHEQQEKLRKLNHEITEASQKFESNIAASTGRVQVTEKQLDGLPKGWIAKHPAVGGKVEITTDYPDFIPFVTYANDRAAVAPLYVKFLNRGGDENLSLLTTILQLRDDKAKLLGYANWAAYAIEPRMAKTPQAVHDFLENVRKAVEAPASAEFAELVKAHVALGGTASDKIMSYDRAYLQDKVKQQKYAFDSKELESYFEIGKVTQGLLDISARMYSLTYKKVPANAWHEDVTAYEVWSDGKMIGKFYLDLYSRPDKFKHAAMFPVRVAKLLADGTYQLPVASLECNFPKPGAEPALMPHTEVVTFFHEFGHVLHHILTTSQLASYSGTNAVRDFVEAPSQMFEEWAWSREVLDLFAAHVKTGAKIPNDLFSAMQKARTFGRALDTQRQLGLAALDLAYHTRDPHAAGFDTTKIYQEIDASTSLFAYVPGTHFQTSFGHLIGYDAGYYGYQWALALSRDVLTRFQKEGLLNPTTAAAWRATVLSKGGGEDEREMVTNFLGRAPNNDAYIAFLKEQSR